MAQALVNETRICAKEEIKDQMGLRLRQKLISLPMANRNH